jgi:MFS family permease
LGLVSLLNDGASEMIAPLLPIFLTGTLGGAPALLGLVEGAADASAAVLKLFSGYIAERGGRRPMVILGYGLAALTRPLLATVGSAGPVVALRVTDRIGKGIRTTPRDVLLVAGVPKERLASVYGFHRAMDHAGAVVGAFAAWLLLRSGVEDLRSVFLWSTVPSLVLLVLLVVLVRDPGGALPAKPVALAPPTIRMRWFLAAVCTFGLGRASDAFLLLAAGTAGARTEVLPLLWMALHAVKSTASAWAGPLADRLGRRGVIAFGWVFAAAIYLAFTAAHSPIVFGALFIVYGLYHGLTEGAEKAVAAELAEGHTGVSLGWYNLASGLVALPAGLLFGGLWTAFGPHVAFAVGAVLALAALAPLYVSTRSA